MVFAKNHDFCHIARLSPVYQSVMDPMFAIPKDRKRSSVFRLCLVMGFTALLFIVVAHRLGNAAEAVLMAPNM